MISRATNCKSFSLPCRPWGHFVQSPNEVLGGEACHCLVLEAQASGFQTFIMFIYYYQSSSRVGCFLECSIYGTLAFSLRFSRRPLLHRTQTPRNLRFRAPLHVFSPGFTHRSSILSLLTCHARGVAEPNIGCKPYYYAPTGRNLNEFPPI